MLKFVQFIQENSLVGKKISIKEAEKMLKRTSINLANCSEAADFFLSKNNIGRFVTAISKKLGTNFEYNVQKINGNNNIINKSSRETIDRLMFKNGEEGFAVNDMDYIASNYPSKLSRINRNEKMGHAHVESSSFIKTNILKITLESVTLKFVTIISTAEYDNYELDDPSQTTYGESLFRYLIETTGILKTERGNTQISQFNYELDYNFLDRATDYFFDVRTKNDVARIIKNYGEKVKRQEKILSVEETYKLLEKDFKNVLNYVSDTIKKRVDETKTTINRIKRDRSLKFPFSIEESGRYGKHTKNFQNVNDYIIWKLNGDIQLYNLATDNAFYTRYVKDVINGYIDEYKLRIAEVQRDYGKILDASSSIGRKTNTITIEATFKTVEGNVHLITFPAGDDFGYSKQRLHLRTKITLLRN